MIGETGYVVVGAGAFDASTAYHLARRGAGGVVLLDRYEIGSQTSPRTAGLCRKVINQRIGKIVRVVRWATENELIPPGTYQALKAVSGLRKGRSAARESRSTRTHASASATTGC